MRSQHTQDSLVEDYLQGGTGLSRIYRETRDIQPPAAVDEAILAAARRAVKSSPRVTHGPFTRRWTVPISLAAVLVLSVGLVTQMREHEMVSDDAERIIPPLEQDPGTAPAPLRKKEFGPPPDAGASDVLESDRYELGRPAPGASTASSAVLRKRSPPPPPAREIAKPRPPIKPRSLSAPDQSSEWIIPPGVGRSDGGVAGHGARADRLLEAELERIRALRRQGRLEEAKAKLVEFRKQYPAYRLTAEFEALLDKKNRRRP